MNFTLTKPYKYDELKMWFEEYIDELPESLDTLSVDFRNVAKSVNVNITSIDAQMAGINKPNQVVKSYKNRLVIIYEGLQVKESWNNPMQKVENKSFSR